MRMTIFGTEMLAVYRCGDRVSPFYGEAKFKLNLPHLTVAFLCEILVRVAIRATRLRFLFLPVVERGRRAAGCWARLCEMEIAGAVAMALWRYHCDAVFSCGQRA